MTQDTTHAAEADAESHDTEATPSVDAGANGADAAETPDRQTPTPQERIDDLHQEYEDAKARERRAKVKLRLLQREADDDAELTSLLEEKTKLEDWAEAAREDDAHEEAREYMERVREIRPRIESLRAEYSEKVDIAQEVQQEAAEEARKAENKAERLLEKHEDLDLDDPFEEDAGEGLRAELEGVGEA